MSQTADTLLRLSEAAQEAKISRMTIYRLMARDQFPRQVELSPGRVGWWKSEIDAWKQSRPRRASVRASGAISQGRKEAIAVA